MSGKDLFREIGLMKEEYITEAEEYKNSVIHQGAFRRGLAVAACLVVCGGLYWGVGYNGMSSDSTSESTNNTNSVSMEMDSTTIAQNNGNTAPKNESIMDMEAVAGESMGERGDEDIQSDASEGFFTDGTDVQDSVPAVREESESEAVATGKDAECIDGMNMSEKELAVWEAFVEATETGTPAQIKVHTQSEDGADLWIELAYDGMCYQVIRQNAAGETTQAEQTYPYLNQMEEGRIVQVFLSDEQIETNKQWEQAENILHLFRYEKK